MAHERPSANDRLGQATDFALEALECFESAVDHDASQHARERLAAALTQTSPDHPSRPYGICVLATLDLAIFRRTGDIAWLERGFHAISADIDTVADEIGATAVVGLIMQFARERFDANLLYRAESLARQGLITLDVNDRSPLRYLLASILLDRHDWRHDSHALEEAIFHSDHAVREATESHEPEQLARALSIRAFARYADQRTGIEPQSKLNDALRDARAAWQLARQHELGLGEYGNQLAVLLTERFDLLGDSGDLDQAINVLDEALDACPAADEFPSLATNQANALHSRFGRDRDAADLDRGIELMRAAIAATRPDSAQLAARHDALGRLLAMRDRLDEAETQASLAIRHTPTDSPDRALYLNNQAMWATYRWNSTHNEDDLDHVIELLEAALSAVTESPQNDPPATGGLLAATITYNLGARLMERFDARMHRGHEDLPVMQCAADLLDDALAAGYPHLSVHAGVRLGDIASRVRFWDRAEHAFRLALAAAGELTGIRAQQPDKERARFGVQGIGAVAALCAARAGNPAAGAVHMEQASATLIAEAVRIETDAVTFGSITAAAQAMGRSILFLGATQTSGIAILVSTEGEVRHLELPALTEPEVADQVTTFRRALQADNAVDVAAQRCRAADTLAAWTTETLLAPLEPLLENVTRVAILPLGRLAWLPLTTAGPPGRAAVLADREPVLLIRATAPPNSDDAAKATGHVIIWADSGPADHHIPAVIREAHRVRSCYPEAEVRINKRSSARPEDRYQRRDRLSELFSAEIVHLACHCEVNVEQPRDTILQVDPPIRVASATAGARVGRTHVVLSACDAALTGASLPDEALSVASAFLLAGAGIVTAPLWPVCDSASPTFMKEYHSGLALGLEPARALAEVQQRWAPDRPRFFHSQWVVTAWPTALCNTGLCERLWRPADQE